MKIKIPNKSVLVYAACIAISLLGCILQSIALVKTDAVLRGITAEQDRQVFSTVSAVLPRTDALYLLRECGGKIGVYDAKTDILIDIVDVFAASLPAADRTALRQGLPIRSLAELASVIEDLST